jgi:electron transport complex protein RnfD
MRDVTIALLPAAAFGVYNFGLRALTILVLSIVSAMAAEALSQKIRKVPITVDDFSAVVTGLLLGMNLPVSVPLWLPIVGSAFAIIIVKQAFGGLGHNFMNPALAARAMLVASWPVEMTTWTAVKADAVTNATTLGILKEGLNVPVPSITDALLGTIGGSIGETSALLLLLGGLYLIYRGIISIRIPGLYIGTVAILTLIITGFDVQTTILHVLAGGLILGAFFMATDYASSPITAKGQVIYAIGMGVITVVIRMYGGYPEGVSYSILLMNVVAPLIDKYTKPRVFGGAK